jgi:hypothetical protein
MTSEDKTTGGGRVQIKRNGVRLWALGAMSALALGGFVAGCGGNDSSSTTTTSGGGA